MRFLETLIKKDRIKAIAERLGLINVRICKITGKDNNLNLLVSANDEQSANNGNLLAAILMNELSCITTVTVESRLKPLFSKTIVENSVSIETSDTNDFKRIFSTDDFQQIEFENFDKNNLENKRELDRMLRLAKRLMEKRGTYDPSFFSSEPLPKPSIPEVQPHLMPTEQQLLKEYSVLPPDEQKARAQQLVQSLGLGLRVTGSPQGSPQHQPKYGIVK